MPVHDWSLVSAGDFHDFHVSWLAEIKKSLNGGLLPADYYASVEQHVQGYIPDVTTLRAGMAAPRRPNYGGVLIAEPRRQPTAEAAAPKVQRRERLIAVRNDADSELVAVIEVISLSNKSSSRGFDATLLKATDFLNRGVHLVILDMIPPGRFDPNGLHSAIWEELTGEHSPPPAKPLTVASYRAGSTLRAYAQELAPGDLIEDVPLFLRDGCVEMPVEASYRAAFDASGFPIRNVLEPPS